MASPLTCTLGLAGLPWAEAVLRLYTQYQVLPIAVQVWSYCGMAWHCTWGMGMWSYCGMAWHCTWGMGMRLVQVLWCRASYPVSLAWGWHTRHGDSTLGMGVAH